jgi:hypothetical protein
MELKIWQVTSSGDYRASVAKEFREDNHLLGNKETFCAFAIFNSAQ